MLPTLPEYLQRQLPAQYGPDTARLIEEGFTRRRRVTLRVNTLRTTPEAVLRTLEAAGIAAERVPWYADALLLPEAREDVLRALPLYDSGEIYLQSLSAMVPALLLSPQPGETILDMAAAPGGKTTQLSALSGGGALITACEKNRIRAERLQFNLDRQGARRVVVMQQDARQLDDLFSFEKILLDAPCTGSGTLLLVEGEPQRRMDESWVKKTVATQTVLLNKALRLLQPGHEMVYSTCSILESENEGVLRAVLPRFGAEVLPIDPALTAALPCLPVTLPGTLCIRPTERYEGFFVARIRKRR